MLILFVINADCNFLQPMMKMIKHCHEEGSGTVDMAQGALLGLVVDKRLEITNCFPFPKHSDESIDEGNFFAKPVHEPLMVNFNDLFRRVSALYDEETAQSKCGPSACRLVPECRCWKLHQPDLIRVSVSLPKFH